MAKCKDSPGLGSLAGAALTAISTLVVTGFAAVVGIIIAREFGRTEETDGFFAAYGVFIVIVLASQSIRIAVLPALARAQERMRLAGTVAGFAVALVVVALPLLVAFEVATEPFARLLTGGGSDVATDACVEALRWMIPAAVTHLFAGLAASGLAALDDYVTAAFAYAAGSAAGLTLMLMRVDEDGLVAVARGMLLNGLVALAVPTVVLAIRAWRARMPATAARPSGGPLRARLGLFAAAAALPIALQLLYVICLPFAGRLGEGAMTSFGYAYLLAASFVTVAAFSIGLVSSVPLTRRGLDAETATQHVVSSTWVALAAIAPGVGVFALVGGGVVEGVLGDAYGGEIGAEIGELVLVLAAWMVASVGVNVAFPLAFVTQRLRALPWIGVAVLTLQVLLAWLLSELLGLEGLGVALAVTTFLALAALLRELGAPRLGLRGIVIAATTVAGIAVASFLPLGLLLDGTVAAVAGLVLYGILLALVRPRGLSSSWSYLRALR